jgi:hypothetical protein
MSQQKALSSMACSGFLARSGECNEMAVLPAQSWNRICIWASKSGRAVAVTSGQQLSKGWVGKAVGQAEQ